MKPPSRSSMRPTVPPRPPKRPLVVADSYRAELAARCEAIGMGKVADKAKMSRQTLWRVLRGEDGRRPTVDAIESIRLALAQLEPDAEPVPPPVIAIRSFAHAVFCAIADKLDPATLESIAADPSPVIRAARARKPRRK